MALPEDLVFFEILPKLRVKSLMRFKCVSKNWMIRISGDSLLIDAHRRLQQHMALVLHDAYIDDEDDVYIDDEEILAHPDLDQEDYPPFQTVTMCSEQLSKAKGVDWSYLIKENGSITVMGSCKGLLCLTFDDFPERVVLWNPATRQRRQLSIPADSSRIWGAGIGLDEVSGDWKVVRLCLESDDLSTESPEDASLVRAHVLAKSSTVWRDGGVSGIKGYFQYIGMAPVAAAGALHWNFFSTLPPGENDHESILSFDLTDEVFRFANGPEDYFELCNWRSSLAALTYEGRQAILSVASPSCSGSGLSWIKLVTFNHMVLYVWREHYLLYEQCRDSVTMLMVDPEAPEKMTSLKHIRAATPAFRIYDYVESIISVF